MNINIDLIAAGINALMFFIFAVIWKTSDVINLIFKIIISFLAFFNIMLFLTKLGFIIKT